MNPQTQTSGAQVAKQDKPQAISGKAKSADQPKEKFPWLIALLLVGAATAAVILIIAASKTPSNPIEQEKTYTLEVTYYRVDVKNLDELGFGPFIFIGQDGGRIIDSLVDQYEVDNYTFRGDFPKQQGAGIYCITARDSAREELLNDGTILVGYKFKIRVKETGSEIVLVNILKNTIISIVGITDKSTMGRFRLTEDGEVFEY